MRATCVLAFILLVVPLAAAHGDGVIYRLRIDAAGPAAGPAAFHLHEDHRLLGIGVGGCALGSVGALRIVTPTQGIIAVTLTGTSCSGAASGVSGDASHLEAGAYAGSYAFSLTGPLLIEVYGNDG